MHLYVFQPYIIIARTVIQPIHLPQSLEFIAATQLDLQENLNTQQLNPDRSPIQYTAIISDQPQEITIELIKKVLQTRVKTLKHIPKGYRHTFFRLYDTTMSNLQLAPSNLDHHARHLIFAKFMFAHPGKKKKKSNYIFQHRIDLWKQPTLTL